MDGCYCQRGEIISRDCGGKLMPNYPNAPWPDISMDFIMGYLSCKDMSNTCCVWKIHKHKFILFPTTARGDEKKLSRVWCAHRDHVGTYMIT